MRRFIIALIVALCAPGAAFAQSVPVSSLTLELGETAVLRFDEGGGALLSERGPASELSPFVAAVGRDNAEGVYDYAIGNQTARIPQDGYPEAPPIAPYILRMSFVSVPGREDTLLVIENGYELAFSYRVRITPAGESPEPSDVCLATPNRYHLEHWPYAIERIEVFNLSTRPWREGDPVPCI